MPVNALLIRALLQYYLYYGDNFKIGCPTGSGNSMNLFEVAREIANRLSRIFLRDQAGRRPVFGGAEKFQSDPHWRDYSLFYEYFHGDNGAGVGASHQTRSIEEMIPAQKQAIRLSPRDPHMGNIYWRIGLAHLLQSRTDDAILWLETARTANPALSFVHAWLATAYALKGKTERAAAELAKARSLRGQGSYASIARIEATGHWGYRRSAPCSQPRISPACARRGCRRNEGYPCRLRSLVERAAQGCNTPSS
jgi:tetratricopeptide (TPR) repeat protein